MINWLNFVLRAVSSGIGTLVLVLIATSMATGAIALTALYLVNHVEETPGIKKLWCLVQPERPGCPRHGEALARLEATIEQLEAQRSMIAHERDQMEAERDRIIDQLAGLRAIEAAVDEITTFKTVTDPDSDLKTTIGTVYTKFVDPSPEPERYFCYISLTDGAAGEDRNLYIRTSSGDVDVSDATLDRLDLSKSALAFSRSVCKPRLVKS